MPSRHILIVYGTSHGHTAKVARYVTDQLRAAGDAITLANVADLPRDTRLADFDGVVVGSPILYGRHRRAVRRFVLTHRDTLNALPSAFFSVSGSAAGRTEAERDAARTCVDQFLRETGWHPGLTKLVGGAMAYTKYGPLLRWVTRRAAQKSGGPTDTSRDHEFTDWEDVRRFAEAFAATVPHRSEQRPLVAT
jgi:menaquinone-dependent protoporphyrinogen oxidase